MQSGRHIDTAVVVVGAAERDVFGGEIGANSLKENSQIHSVPLPNIITALNTYMPDNNLLLRQRSDPLGGPGLFVRGAAAKLSSQLVPSTGLMSSTLEEAVVARRFDYVGLGEG